MISKIYITTVALLLITGCTFDQLASTAYNSAGTNECIESTGGPSCDLDMRTNDERLMNGAPTGLSNKELEQQAQKIRENIE